MRTRKKTSGKWSSARVLALLCGLVLAGAEGTGALGQGNVGKSELAGLSSSIASMSWRDEHNLTIQFHLEWVQVPNTWALNDSEPVNVSFWNDAVGSRRVGPIQLEMIRLQQGFVEGSAKTEVATLTVRVPPRATAVSLAFGTSGLETARVPLPKK